MQLVNVNDVYSLFEKNGTARLHIADIDQLPRVKYQAPRAKWIKTSYWGVSRCSNCNKPSTTPDCLGEFHKYCPECGAEMELEGI